MHSRPPAPGCSGNARSPGTPPCPRRERCSNEAGFHGAATQSRVGGEENPAVARHGRSHSITASMVTSPISIFRTVTSSPRWPVDATSARQREQIPLDQKRSPSQELADRISHGCQRARVGDTPSARPLAIAAQCPHDPRVVGSGEEVNEMVVELPPGSPDLRGRGIHEPDAGRVFSPTVGAVAGGPTTGARCDPATRGSQYRSGGRPDRPCQCSRGTRICGPKPRTDPGVAAANGTSAFEA